MKYYELVLVFDASTTLDAIKKIRVDIESMVSKVIDIDDIGMLPIVTKLHGHFSAYFISYYINSDLLGLDAIKQYIRITKTIAKFHIFAMSKNENFMKYDVVKKQYEILALRDAPKKLKQGEKKEVQVIEEVIVTEDASKEENEITAQGE